jgi:hypothetical protein
LLENKVVELNIVDRASDSTIGRVLKKNTLKPHRREQWVIPPKANSAFVAAMEDVLAVYTRPRDPDRPLVCLDESSKQLIAETRLPIPMKPGRPARCDYEYEQRSWSQHLSSADRKQNGRSINRELRDLARQAVPPGNLLAACLKSSASSSGATSRRHHPNPAEA